MQRMERSIDGSEARASEPAVAPTAATAAVVDLFRDAGSRIDHLDSEEVRRATATNVLRSRLRGQLAFDLAQRELGLGNQFATAGAGRYLYSESEKLWLWYDADLGIWVRGESHAREEAKAIAGAALDTVRDQMVAAARSGIAEDLRAAQSAFKLATGLQREQTIGAVLNVARTAHLLRVDGPGEFDRDRDLLCVANGVVDLRTGELLPHDPGLRMRKRAPVRYEPDAACPRWKAFVEEITCSVAGQAAYLQRAAGYTVTGHVSDEVVFFMYGIGSNGKSVWANVFEHLLGDYAVRVPGEFLMVDSKSAGKREGASPLLASIAGSRMVLVNEVEAGVQLSGQQVKVLASTERITARPMYRDPITFEPTHKVWARGNHKPIVVETDHGLWRRLHLIPFLRRFSKEESDPELAGRLIAEELPGILAWACAGAREWYKTRKLGSTAVVEEATKDYRTESDLVGQWLEENCEQAPGVSEPIGHAYGHYEAWAEVNGLRPMSQPALTRRLAELGIATERIREGGTRKRIYVGLKVSTPKPF